MAPGRGSGQGSPRGKGVRRMGFLEAQIRRANGESIPVWNNMTNDGESSDEGETGVKNSAMGAGRVGRSGDRRNSGQTTVRSDNVNAGHRGARDESGLNPRRIRGFGAQASQVTDPPSLNDMRAKQGAIVAKFMTFFKRKSTIVIEMYEACFYKDKPRFDQIANFVYNDLCPTDDLRKAVRDVQLHPVKMLIFVRFSEDRFRDHIAAKIRSSEGITWSEYKVKVKGYSLDAEVKFIRLLGVSPETELQEIKRVSKRWELEM